MEKNTFQGILYAASGSLWWGTLGVLYFKSAAFAGPIELVVHRTVWTAFFLVITTSIYSRWSIFLNSLKNKKNLTNLSIIYNIFL